MKKKCVIILICVLTACLSGCVSAIELDKEQEDRFVGYAVYSVLEHDKNYMVGLNHVELETVTDVEEETDTGIQEPSTPVSGEDRPDGSSGNNEGAASGYTSMEKALDVEKLTVTYKDFKVCGEYPEADGTPAFAMTALKGNKLVVLKFDVTNATSSDIVLDLASKKFAYKGVFNDLVRTAALVTLLPHGLNTYSDTIQAGTTVEMVLVFEIKEVAALNITDIVLEIKSSKGINSVKIK